MAPSTQSAVYKSLQTAVLKCIQHLCDHRLKELTSYRYQAFRHQHVPSVTAARPVYGCLKHSRRSDRCSRAARSDSIVLPAAKTPIMHINFQKAFNAKVSTTRMRRRIDSRSSVRQQVLPRKQQMLPAAVARVYEVPQMSSLSHVLRCAVLHSHLAARPAQQYLAEQHSGKFYVKLDSVLGEKEAALQLHWQWSCGRAKAALCTSYVKRSLTTLLQGKH